MKVGVLCEESGVVRDEFNRRGHDAWSCDILPRPGKHIRGDCLAQDWSGFDLLICFPPCTYLCSMGVWWNHKRPERQPLTVAALRFVQALWALPAPRIAIENPVGVLSTRWRKPDQVVHPWMFGHEASKPTCLWLKGLPRLEPTAVVGKGEFYVKANGKRAAKWSHRLSGRDHTRARVASRTFVGVAAAMAEQWGSLEQHRATA
jgi:hypothetical protein